MVIRSWLTVVLYFTFDYSDVDFFFDIECLSVLPNSLFFEKIFTCMFLVHSTVIIRLFSVRRLTSDSVGTFSAALFARLIKNTISAISRRSTKTQKQLAGACSPLRRGAF